MATPTSIGAWKYSTSAGRETTDSVLSGVQWSSGKLTYSFAGSGSLWSTSSTTGYGRKGSDNEPWSPSYATLSSSDRSAVRDAFEAWSDVANVRFTEVTDSAKVAGDLRFAYTYLSDLYDAEAWSYLPGPSAYAGDVWFNVYGTSGTEYWTPGSFAYATVLHEIGHALGLKHPFDPKPRSPDVLPDLLDSTSFTLMSYSAVMGDVSTTFSYEPTTPMMFDIAAVQHLYGANTKTNSGDTRYVFRGDADYHRTIWDAGGKDTLVYESSRGGTLDLNAGIGGGSELGNPVYVLDASGSRLFDWYNVWIAEGTVIENAIGGSGSDTIIGNGAANVLSGGKGHDKISGGSGNDRLDGASGRDTLDGGKGNDTLLGGSSGDTLTGSSGNDRLNGGSSADVFVLNSKSGSDTVVDFRSGLDNLRVASASLPIGDGDKRIEGTLTRSAPGGFSDAAELVIFTKNLASLSTTSASSAIGSAKHAYGKGDTALFAIDNGSSSALYLFTSADTDARVEKGELTLLATLSGTAATTAGDYLFG